MKKKAIILFTLCFFLNPSFVRTATRIPKLMKPESMVISSGKLFAAQKGAVLVFDVSGGKKINEFGKRGEGPGEFTGVIRLHRVSENIMVSSRNKISLFSSEGKLIHEARIENSASNAGGFIPFGQAYLGAESVVHQGKVFRTVNLYEKDLRKSKEIFRSAIGEDTNSPTGKLNFFKTSFSYRGIGSAIFISGEDDFVIQMLNEDGTMMKTLRRDYKKIPFTNQDKNNFLNYLKSNSPVYVFQSMSKRLVFPEYFPVIFMMVSDESILYVFTWKQTQKGLECFLYDGNGRFISREEIPLAFESPVMFYPFFISRGVLYQLVEDDEEEIWELITTKIR